MSHRDLSARRSASAAARELRGMLRVRRHLVRARSGAISLLRSLLRQEGVRLASGSAERVLKRLARVRARIAIVALARRLSRILYALWRDRTDFGIPAHRVGAPA